MSITLSINVFNSGYRPVDGGRGWDPAQTATWPACTATLIAGARDAILVDALMTAADGARLAAWVRDSGKNLTSIVVTHGHGDHFFGAGNVLAAFPGAPLVALNAAVVTEARSHTELPILDNWIGWFGDQFDHSPTVPTALGSGDLDIEGHPVKLIEIGGADGALATVIQIPELEAVCSGDAVYNNIHMWLWNSTPESRTTWLLSIDAIARLQPRIIIAGHKDPGAPDDDAQRQLRQSRSYVQDFDRVVAESNSAQQVIEAMMSKYGDYGNPYTLFVSAHSQFPG